MSQIRFLVAPGRRLLMLLLTYVVGLIVTSFAAALLMRMGGDGRMLAMLRISTVVQDIFLFVLPPLITALIVTRQPVRLLALAKLPSLQVSLLAVVVMLVSSPLMTWVIELNDNVHLPESLAGLEASLRALETSAAGAVETLMGPNTTGNLIINILIVGVLAGFSEELFFRGGLQRLLATTKMSGHVAIWLSAFIFSALHMQFFGFVPRMLLGAFFGYMLMWSGSLWLPIMLHALNNSLFVILQSATGSGEFEYGDGQWYYIFLSAILTAIGLYLIYLTCSKQKAEQAQIPSSN